MATPEKQIRVSDTVKRTLDRRRRADESYNDVLERLLAEWTAGDFEDGFGRWSEADAERVRARREAAKADRKARMRNASDEE